jgi:16S rRNA (cytidine1402-2'-O)-methyltransferase
VISLVSNTFIMATLYIVATPIGNLEDVTLRAVRVLDEVDIIFCEDTRITSRLLKKYDIHTKTISLNARTEQSKTRRVLEAIEEGKNVALVSDAGTPTISDPGATLINEAKKAGVIVEVIPGPSAVVSALSASGLPASEFLFLGFLPNKKGRQKLFEEISTSKRTVVFYESPHRILKTLTSLVDYLDNERMVVVVRELTKIHEETIRGSAQEVERYFSQHSGKVRGEFVVVVGGV